MKPITRHRAQRAAVQDRAERAVADLYHNATVTYPRELYGRSEDNFQSWFENAAQFEIEYIADGGASPGDYRATLAAPCNAGKYKSERAQRYYIAKGLRDRDAERYDCGMLTGWRVLELRTAEARDVGSKLARKLAKHYKVPALGGPLTTRLLSVARRNNALWECITEYGKLYQHGRGGRTLAPDGLYSDRSVKFDAAEHNTAYLVDLIQIVESFNAHVQAWCKGVPDEWKYHCEQEDAEALALRRQRAAAKGRETKERNYWAARDVITEGARV